MNGAIFLDRDGTINAQPAPHAYITHPDDLHFLPGALDALAFLAKNSGRKIAVVTNQACIGKTLATAAEVEAVHDRMRAGIRLAGGRIDAIYLCPHTPEDACFCRKPLPGLLIQAARELGVDLGKSCLIGDSATDLRAGWAAGVPEVYLVLTGDPHNKWPETLGWGRRYESYASLVEAAHAIVRKEKEK